jgi:hypothetical protein
LFNLERLIADLYNMTGEVDHLGTAISLGLHAEQTASLASPLEQEVLLSHIGLCLGQQHDHNPAKYSKSLDLGIAKLKSAMATSRPGMDLDILEGLQILLRKRSLITPDDENIKLSLELAKEALNATPAENLEWTRRFKSCPQSHSMHCRYCFFEYGTSRGIGNTNQAMLHSIQ